MLSKTTKIEQLQIKTQMKHLIQIISAKLQQEIFDIVNF